MCGSRWTFVGRDNATGCPYHASLCACCYVSMVCSHRSWRHSVALYCLHLQMSSCCAASLTVATLLQHAFWHYAYSRHMHGRQDKQCEALIFPAAGASCHFAPVCSAPCTAMMPQDTASDIHLSSLGVKAPRGTAAHKVEAAAGIWHMYEVPQLPVLHRVGLGCMAWETQRLKLTHV